jgi:hypothetical protein
MINRPGRGEPAPNTVRNCNSWLMPISPKPAKKGTRWRSQSPKSREPRVKIGVVKLKTVVSTKERNRLGTVENLLTKMEFQF